MEWPVKQQHIAQMASFYFTTSPKVFCVKALPADYHPKLFASALIKRCPCDGVEKLAVTVADALVDLNPERWMPPFLHSPPAIKGALLADEGRRGQSHRGEPRYFPEIGRAQTTYPHHYPVQSPQAVVTRIFYRNSSCLAKSSNQSPTARCGISSPSTMPITAKVG